MKLVSPTQLDVRGYIGISDDFEIKEDNIEALSMKFLQSLNATQFETLIDF